VVPFEKLTFFHTLLQIKIPFRGCLCTQEVLGSIPGAGEFSNSLIHMSAALMMVAFTVVMAAFTNHDPPKFDQWKNYPLFANEISSFNLSRYSVIIMKSKRISETSKLWTLPVASTACELGLPCKR
jgi:hypothetical protein